MFQPSFFGDLSSVALQAVIPVEHRLDAMRVAAGCDLFILHAA
jgi:hypothetical protein